MPFQMPLETLPHGFTWNPESGLIVVDCGGYAGFGGGKPIEAYFEPLGPPT